MITQRSVRGDRRFLNAIFDWSFPVGIVVERRGGRVVSTSDSPPRCINGYWQHNAGGGGGVMCDGRASHPGGSSNTLSRFMLQKLG